MKVKYEQLFPTASFLNCRIGFEMDIPDDGNVDTELTTLKDLATAFHMKEFPQFYKESKPIYSGEEPTTQIEKTPESPVHSMIQAITSCTEVKVLETFRKLAASKPEFQTAFDETMIKLTNTAG